MMNYFDMFAKGMSMAEVLEQISAEVVEAEQKYKAEQARVQAEKEATELRAQVISEARQNLGSAIVNFYVATGLKTEWSEADFQALDKELEALEKYGKRGWTVIYER